MFVIKTPDGWEGDISDYRLYTDSTACEEFGAPLRVIATGGLSSLIVPLCKSEISVEENLVLVGLKLLYHKNTGEP